MAHVLTIADDLALTTDSVLFILFNNTQNTGSL
jgi:hypothetical protein